MRALIRWLIAVFALVTPAHAAEPDLAGIYGGGYGAPPDYVYTQLDLTRRTARSRAK